MKERRSLAHSVVVAARTCIGSRRHQLLGLQLTGCYAVLFIVWQLLATVSQPGNRPPVERVSLLGPAANEFLGLRDVSKLTYLHVLQLLLLLIILPQLFLTSRSRSAQYLQPLLYAALVLLATYGIRTLWGLASATTSAPPQPLLWGLSIISSAFLLSASQRARPSRAPLERLERALLPFSLAIVAVAALVLHGFLFHGIPHFRSLPVAAASVVACVYCAYALSVRAQQHSRLLTTSTALSFGVYALAHLFEPIASMPESAFSEAFFLFVLATKSVAFLSSVALAAVETEAGLREEAHALDKLLEATNHAYFRDDAAGIILETHREDTILGTPVIPGRGRHEVFPAGAEWQRFLARLSKQQYVIDAGISVGLSGGRVKHLRLSGYTRLLAGQQITEGFYRDGTAEELQAISARTQSDCWGWIASNLDAHGTTAGALLALRQFSSRLLLGRVGVWIASVEPNPTLTTYCAVGMQGCSRRQLSTFSSVPEDFVSLPSAWALPILHTQLQSSLPHEESAYIELETSDLDPEARRITVAAFLSQLANLALVPRLTGIKRKLDDIEIIWKGFLGNSTVTHERLVTVLRDLTPGTGCRSLSILLVDPQGGTTASSEFLMPPDSAAAIADTGIQSLESSGALNSPRLVHSSGTSEGADVLIVPITTEQGVWLGALLAERTPNDPFTIVDQDHVEHTARYLGVFLNRERSDRDFRTHVENVLHDLRAPVGVIRNRIERVLDETPNLEADQVARLKVAFAKATLLSQLMRGLDPTNYAGPDRLPTLVYKEVISNALKDLARQFRSKQSPEPLCSSGDFRRIPSLHVPRSDLYRIVSNLISNMAKYGTDMLDRRPPRIYSRETASHYVIVFEDHGAGVAEQERERIFEKGYRGLSVRETEVGSGLGLAIARGLAREMGGELLLARPAGPTVFELHLPKRMVNPA